MVIKKKKNDEENFKYWEKPGGSEHEMKEKYLIQKTANSNDIKLLLD